MVLKHSGCVSNQISEYTSSDTAIAAVMSALALIRSAMYTVVRTHGAMACSHCIYSSTQLTSCSSSVTCVRDIEHYQDCSRPCVLCELCQQTHCGTVTISTTLALCKHSTHQAGPGDVHEKVCIHHHLDAIDSCNGFKSLLYWQVSDRRGAITWLCHLTEDLVRVCVAQHCNDCSCHVREPHQYSVHSPTQIVRMAQNQLYYLLWHEDT
jgi:hypothetical protein